jgi:hypothetical protein
LFPRLRGAHFEKVAQKIIVARQEGFIAKLLRWGYTPQRPIKRAMEQEAVKVGQWLNDIYPGIAARARAEKATIYWCDETAVAEDGHWLRGYAPAGQTPVLAVSSKRHGAAVAR